MDNIKRKEYNIFNRYGQQYRIVATSYGTYPVRLDINGGLAGYANLNWHISSNLLEICDIFVESNQRQSGLGVSLLYVIILLAQEVGVATICGTVVQKDVGETPGILDWYIHQGFSVKNIQNGLTVAKVTFDMAQAGIYIDRYLALPRIALETRATSQLANDNYSGRKMPLGMFAVVLVILLLALLLYLLLPSDTFKL